MKREVSTKEEELRLQNSSELMYGNNDHDQIFPFDVRMRFKYVVYHEAIGYTDDGQPYSKRSTRRFTFIDPTVWDTRYVPKDGMSFFEKQEKTYVILHDPIKQAELENHKIKGYHADKTGLSLQEKLRGAKPAAFVARKNTPTIDQATVSFESDYPAIEGTEALLEEAVVKKAGRPKKEVTNG